ncbi:hypothetical protein [Rathayibacter sp. AY2B9]|uniref:hypothetical protein n=1 Tax=Rathayibacter sp. AY2B9 TaxID=2080572 RepID=UPI000CE8CE5C|nr:hypothetical protein [Rathayibacter sp. AY2B9]PPG34505.1 hypothetical protein C5C25_00345 [Rathayibacter sp. AY2B9]
MNLTETIAPKSDQINADDLLPGPIVVTIAEVVKGNAEQPVDVRLVEYPGRAYRPSKSMRRVLVTAWGPEAAAYTGRRLKLFRNPEIAFGGTKLGGIEIEAMSDIDKPLTIALTTTRSKRKNFTVQPLPAATPARDWPAEIQAVEHDYTALLALHKDATRTGAGEAVLNAIKAAGTRAKEAQG